MALIMSMTMLAGCGGTEDSSSTESKAAANEETASAAANESESTEKTITIAQSAPFSMGFGQGVMVYENTYYADNFYEPLVKYKQLFGGE